MEFVIGSSPGGSLPQEAMRAIVEAVDTWRGQTQAFAVFENSAPYEVVSLHSTEAEARNAAGAGRSYFGPVTPRPAAASSKTVYKKVGCALQVVSQPVSSVSLLDAGGNEVKRFTVNLGGRAPDSENDIEALFVTPSGIDKFVIPYLTRVFGTGYAASKRGEWITD
jgi:hypothetical protein